MRGDYFRRLAVMVGVMISGFGLSQILSVQTPLTYIFMLCVGPLMIVALVPRIDWLRPGVFILLFASVFGIGRLAATVARHFIYEGPLQPPSEYGWQVALYAAYGVIWIIWWIQTKRSSRKSTL